MFYVSCANTAHHPQPVNSRRKPRETKYSSLFARNLSKLCASSLSCLVTDCVNICVWIVCEIVLTENWLQHRGKKHSLEECCWKQQRVLQSKRIQSVYIVCVIVCSFCEQCATNYYTIKWSDPVYHLTHTHRFNYLHLNWAPAWLIHINWEINWFYTLTRPQRNTK